MLQYQFAPKRCRLRCGEDLDVAVELHSGAPKEMGHICINARLLLVLPTTTTTMASASASSTIGGICWEAFHAAAVAPLAAAKFSLSSEELNMGWGGQGSAAAVTTAGLGTMAGIASSGGQTKKRKAKMGAERV